MRASGRDPIADRSAGRRRRRRQPQVGDRPIELGRQRPQGWTDLGRSLDTELVRADVGPDLAGAQRWAFDHGLTHTPDLTSAVPVIEPPALDGLGIDM